jgi:hypothetical protein
MGWRGAWTRVGTRCPGQTKVGKEMGQRKNREKDVNSSGCSQGLWSQVLERAAAAMATAITLS